MNAMGKVVFLRSTEIKSPSRYGGYPDPRTFERVLFVSHDGQVLAHEWLIEPGEHFDRTTTEWTLSGYATGSARYRAMRLEMAAAVLQRLGLKVA